MNEFKNMKIAITPEQPLDEVVKELERIGYIRKQRFCSGENIVATDDEGEFYIFSNDLMLEDFRLTTLAELKKWSDRFMSKFIEVDIANTDSKTLVNVDQIVNVGRYKSDNTGYISFNSSGGVYENCIHTKQSYEELKKLILNAK